jgi:UDP:flavonoid glycosyltransferase YjiC (YdhE family)
VLGQLIYRQMQAGAAALGGGAGIGTGFVAGMAGSIASQMVGLAIGALAEFSWKAVVQAGIGRRRGLVPQPAHAD